MRKIKILTAMFFILMVSIISIPAIYASDEVTSNELQGEIDELEKDKEATESQIEVDKLEYNDLLEESKNIQKSIADTETKITDTENQITELEKEIEDLAKQVEEKQVEVDKLNEQADTSLLALQQIDNQNLMVESLFGDADSIGEVYNRSNSAQVLTQSITTTFDELLDVLNEIKALKEESEAKKVTLEESKTSLEESKVALQSQKEQNDKLSAELNSRIKKNQQAVVKLEQSTEELEQQQQVLESAGCGPNDVYGVDCAVPSSGGPAPALSGFTRPTTNGYMSNPFGYAGYDVTGGGFHPGVDIATSCGTPLYASAPGTVITVRHTSYGYGNYVAIVHNVGGKNYVTLYGHMQSTYVTPGQQVGYNTQIGTLGTSGSSTGCHVHFSINTGTTLASYSELYRFVDPTTMISFPPYYSWYYSRY